MPRSAARRPPAVPPAAVVSTATPSRRRAVAPRPVQAVRLGARTHRRRPSGPAVSGRAAERLTAWRTHGAPARASRPGPRRPVGAPDDVDGWSDAVSAARARRAVAVVVTAFLVAATALLADGLLAGSDGVAADAVPSPSAAGATSASPTDPHDAAVPVRRHVVRAGETMWSIAHRYRGEVGHADYLHALIDRNGGVSIQVGQAIHLP